MSKADQKKSFCDTKLHFKDLIDGLLHMTAMEHKLPKNDIKIISFKYIDSIVMACNLVSLQTKMGMPVHRFLSVEQDSAASTKH